MLCRVLSRIVNRIIIECNKIFSNDDGEEKQKNSKMNELIVELLRHAVLAHLYSRLILFPPLTNLKVY